MARWISRLLESLKGREWAIALGLILLSLVKGAFLFAPQLIAFHDMARPGDPLERLRGDREPRAARGVRDSARRAHVPRRDDLGTGIPRRDPDDGDQHLHRVSRDLRGGRSPASSGVA
jgi:hypothetical protein